MNPRPEVEYYNLPPGMERDIFQRVQLGMTLTAAGPYPFPVITMCQLHDHTFYREAPSNLITLGRVLSVILGCSFPTNYIHTDGYQSWNHGMWPLRVVCPTSWNGTRNVAVTSRTSHIWSIAAMESRRNRYPPLKRLKSGWFEWTNRASSSRQILNKSFSDSGISRRAMT